ncbi:teichoic acid biosynthesis protein A [Gordonia rhizosphera NBRC 16068]|uniref:Teichoic acid biosynthesis protein A n=1 Tax=Gordonia rhizosphera NBRC 16068 TaxID=1108045 RepID=K6VZK2_9ACTN|nr:teichoic acid biosynthesis protein A [Gordonia rhizosphera NBRC 16068]
MTMTETSPAVSEIFGLRIDALTLAQAVDRCRDAIASRKPVLIGVVNAAKAVNVQKDVLLREALLRSDIAIADGQAVVWASRILGQPLPERVTGIDLFEALLAAADRDGNSVYLLGARADVLRQLESVLAERYPSVRIVGSRDGYFDSDEQATIATDIRDVKPDMLFLGMPSPRKEMFLAQWADLMQVPVLHGVGGSFDVMAGKTKRAPVWWQTHGLEWAYRLLQEPRRMWRRYLTTNTLFVLMLARERVRPRRAYSRPTHEPTT